MDGGKLTYRGPVLCLLHERIGETYEMAEDVCGFDAHEPLCPQNASYKSCKSV